MKASVRVVALLAVLLTFSAPAFAQLPSGWASSDIGAVGATGATTTAGTTFTVNGAGADVWGSADALHFAHRQLTGDGSIVAQVAAIDNINAWVKAGVMMRETLSPGARHAFMLTSYTKGHAFQRRLATAGASTHTSGGTGSAPVWVRLTRAGNTFTAHRSLDGVTWTLVGSDTIAMGPTIYVGVGVSSHVAGVLASGTFENVEVTAAGTGGAGSTTPPPPPPPPPSTEQQLRILHWNVHHGGQRSDGVTDRDGLTTWMASFNADVFSLNELDSLANLNDIVARLTKKTGTTWYVSYDYGIALVSRFPIESKSSCVINSSLGRKIVRAGIVVNGRTINIWSAHLDAYSATTRQSEMGALLKCVEAFPEQRIVAGDLNAGSTSAEIKLLAGSYIDAWPAAKALGTAVNYPGNADGATRSGRIDYVFASRTATQLVLKSAQIFDTRNAAGVMASDHKPLLVVYDVK
jgi:endonuclease/exonuclease/phosphatase family metal-dependent hydrolase/regulation of enolase protein 1 (concanavalin A-like superfamily)